MVRRRSTVEAGTPFACSSVSDRLSELAIGVRKPTPIPLNQRFAAASRPHLGASAALDLDFVMHG
jgi:hypothetical protein